MGPFSAPFSAPTQAKQHTTTTPQHSNSTPKPPPSSPPRYIDLIYPDISGRYISGFPPTDIRFFGTRYIDPIYPDISGRCPDISPRYIRIYWVDISARSVATGYRPGDQHRDQQLRSTTLQDHNPKTHTQNTSFPQTYSITISHSKATLSDHSPHTLHCVSARQPPSTKQSPPKHNTQHPTKESSRDPLTPETKITRDQKHHRPTAG